MCTYIYIYICICIYTHCVLYIYTCILITSVYVHIYIYIYDRYMHTYQHDVRQVLDMCNAMHSCCRYLIQPLYITKKRYYV